MADNSVQRAPVAVRNAIYEEEFRGVAYGFRPGRTPHEALEAVTGGLEQRTVNGVLAAAMRGCGDPLAQEGLVKCVEHRIGDRRVGRHRRQWVKAGVREEGPGHAQEEGTPQGGRVSPLAAHISLPDGLDLGAARWRRQHARGEVSIVRSWDGTPVQA